MLDILNKMLNSDRKSKNKYDDFESEDDEEFMLIKSANNQ